ncbi:MAG: hypothetical protein COB59_08635 [Rhodospirillaceae bacterium]|nr:MAG: hypothetical protein COB59_08635 [Rhodospirillaceae bacterium]
MGTNNPQAPIHDKLCSTLCDAPRISELSEIAGLSERRLNAAFRKLYGGTIFETIRNLRLDEARKMLEQTDIAIKKIAWQVGYEHSTIFTNAFTAKFGTSPASYPRLIARPSARPSASAAA